MKRGIIDNQSLINNLRDGYLAIDMESRILTCNKVFEELVGYSQEELCGKSIQSISPLDWYENERKSGIYKLLKKGYSGLYEKEYLHKDGRHISIEIEAFLTSDDTGNPEFIYALVREIRDRSAIEKQLNETEKRFRDFTFSLADWVWELDTDGKYTYASGRVKELTGYNPEEIIGKTPFDLMPAVEARRLRGLFSKIVSEKLPIRECENKLLTRDGKELTLSTNGMPVLDEKGSLIGYRGINKDITARKKAEEQISLFKMIADQSNQGVGVGTLDGTITYVNQTLCDLMEAGHADDLIGTSFTQYYQGIYLKKMTEVVFPAILKTGHWSGELKLTTLKGTEFVSSETYNLINDADGNPLYISAVIEDHTGKRQIQDELFKYRTDLESIVDEKTKELKNSQEDLMEKKADADLINILNQAANEGKTLTEVLAIAAQATKKMFHGLGSAIYLFDANQKYLELQNHGLLHESIGKIEILTGWKSRGIRIPVDSKHPYLDIIHKGKAKYFNDAQEIIDLYTSFADALGVKRRKNGISTYIMNHIVKALKLNAIVTVPLVIRNRPIGILDMGSRLSFSSSDIRRIETLADQLALIINNKLTDASLHNSQENLSAVIENNNGSIWSVDRNYRILTLNSIFREDFKAAFGIELKVGSNVMEHLPEPLVDIWTERYSKAIGGEKFVIEDAYEVQGERRYFEVALNPIKHEDEVTGVSVFASDITEKKNAFVSLQRSEERVRAFISAMPDSTYILDQDARFVEILSSSVKSPIPREAILNKLAEDVMPDEGAKLIKKFVHKTLETGQPQTLDYSFTTGGRSLWFEGRTAMVRSPEEDQKLVFWISRNITDKKLAETELNRTMHELERSNNELQQFAYVASHDLQEPLRKVKNFTDLFAAHYSDLQDEKAKKYISYITDGSARMQTLISDLLSFSRVATHQKPFEKISMGRILDQAVDNLQLAIEESQAEITYDQLPVVTVDGPQLTQVLFNLVANAIKFRKEDEPPKIHVGFQELTDNWRFSIKDNGIGIDSAYADKIFVVFQRLHGHTEYAGNGIGLALCKKIVERHQGDIWFESKINKGTTFHFTIPKKHGNNVNESIQSN